VLNNTRFLVSSLSGMELSEVLSSDGSELLGFDLTSDHESLLSTSLKLSLVFSDLLVNNDKSHFTLLHGSLSSSSYLSNKGSVSLLTCSINKVNLLSVGCSSLSGSLLESEKMVSGFRLAMIFSKVNVLLNFMDDLSRLPDPVLLLHVSGSPSAMVVVSMEDFMLNAALMSVDSSFKSLFSSHVSSVSASIVSELTLLPSVSTGS